jgi:hypothetical protein
VPFSRRKQHYTRNEYKVESAFTKRNQQPELDLVPCVYVFNKERDFFAGAPLRSTGPVADAISGIFLLFFAKDYSLSLVHRKRNG